MDDRTVPVPIHADLVERYRRFRSGGYASRVELYGKLATSQKPRVLFITCSDSRVVPTMVLAGDPGDVFVCQIVGNIVPAYGDTFGGVSATVEYAVTALAVEAIIVCGHSDCGAMKAVQHIERYVETPAIASWLRHADAAKRVASAEDATDEHEHLATLTRENVIAQLENLRTHPAVALGRHRGLRLYGWVYDIGDGTVESYDDESGSFAPLDEVPLDTVPADAVPVDAAR